MTQAQKNQAAIDKLKAEFIEATREADTTELDTIVTKLLDAKALLVTMPGSREVSIARTSIEGALYRLRDLQDVRDGTVFHRHDAG